MQRLPTPTARDWKDTPGTNPKGINPDGSIRDRTDRLAVWVYKMEREEGNTNPAPLNPGFSELLMGWPIGWTDLKPLGTDKSQQWLDLHGKSSRNQPGSDS